MENYCIYCDLEVKLKYDKIFIYKIIININNVLYFFNF